MAFRGHSIFPYSYQKSMTVVAGLLMHVIACCCCYLHSSRPMWCITQLTSGRAFRVWRSDHGGRHSSLFFLSLENLTHSDGFHLRAGDEKAGLQRLVFIHKTSATTTVSHCWHWRRRVFDRRWQACTWGLHGTNIFSARWHPGIGKYIFI